MPYLSQVFIINDKTTLQDIYDWAIDFFDLDNDPSKLEDKRDGQDGSDEEEDEYGILNNLRESATSQTEGEKVLD